MPTYTAPAVENPAVPEHEEADGESGDMVLIPATVETIGVAVDPIPAGQYHYNDGAGTFTVTTTDTLSPIPAGWVEA